MCIQCVIPCIPYWVEFHLLLVASWSTTETGFEILFVCHVMFVVNVLNIRGEWGHMAGRKHKKKGGGAEAPPPLFHLRRYTVTILTNPQMEMIQIAVSGSMLMSITSSPLPSD